MSKPAEVEVAVEVDAKPKKPVIGYLRLKDGFQRAQVLREGDHAREIQFIGGPEDGKKLVIPPHGIPNGEFHPSFFEQEKEPEVWSYKGRSLLIRHPEEFKNPKEAELLVPEVEPYEFLPHTTQIIDGVLAGDHQLLFGPTGVGKSSAILQIAARIGQPVLRLNFTTQVGVSDIVGSMTYKSGTGTVWNDGALPRAMRAGYWLLMDEFDFCPADIASLFHPVLESKPMLCLKENDGEIVRAHPGFRVFANGNALAGDNAGHYVGTQPLNKALVNRFTGHGIVIGIKPLTYRQELGVLKQRMPNIPVRILKRAAQTASNLRSGDDEVLSARRAKTGSAKVNASGDNKRRALYPILSTRDVINWVTKTVLYRDAIKAAQLTFLPMIGDEATKGAISDVIEARFGRRVVIGKGTLPRNGTGEKPALEVLDAKPSLDGESDETPTPGAKAVKTPKADTGDKTGRVASAVLDPDEMRVIYKAYKGNGGTLSFEKMEKVPEFNLRDANGNTAQRICRKFEALLKEGTVKLDPVPIEAVAEAKADA